MSSASKTETGGFKYIWKIENFSKCALEKGDSLASPKFVVEDLYKSAWWLTLYPRGLTDEEYLECILTRDSADCGPKSINIRYVVSLITKDETGQEPYTEKGKFKNGDTSTFYYSQLRKEIFENRSVYLPKDTLCVVCYLQKDTGNGFERQMVECTARTRISVERVYFTWNIKNFFDNPSRLSNELIRVVRCATKFKSPPSISMELRFNGADRDVVHVLMSKNKTKPIFVGFKLRLVDVHTKLHHFCQGEHFFSSQEREWVMHSNIIRKLSKEKGLFVANNTLSIQCEFEMSFGIITFEIEELKTLPQTESKHPVGLNPLLFDLQSMYVEQKLCDFSFRIGDRTFKSHKLILGARSPVFRAMFESDMMEVSNNSVDIEDLDFDTMDGMLMFLYTDALEEDLGFESALKLYGAADKYQIESLRRTCVRFLGSRISAENFCDLLVVVNLHQDDKLMDAVMDFMLGHHQEIMKWSVWKELMENNFGLAVETLRQVLNRIANV